MEIDVYAPCPCGSGKKLKFCCAPIVEDMAKVARLASRRPVASGNGDSRKARQIAPTQPLGRIRSLRKC